MCASSALPAGVSRLLRDSPMSVTVLPKMSYLASTPEPYQRDIRRG